MAQQQQKISSSLPQSLWRAEDVQQIEQHWAQQAGNDLSELMLQAGAAAFACLQQQWPEAKRVLIFAGGGNNGGDAYVVALLALKQGLSVQLIELGDPHTLPVPAQRARQLYQKVGFAINDLACANWQVDVVVDGLLGIGLRGEVRPAMQALIEQINRSQLPVLALDIPSGLCADTGQILGCAIEATLTISFVALKQGLVTGQAAAHVGHLMYADLGLALPDAFRASLLQPCHPWAQLPLRHPCAHKGTHGRLLMIGGNLGMSGAIRLAGEAGLRSGAGLVKLATHLDSVLPIASACPELMVRGVCDAESLAEWQAGAKVVLVGPGLGRDAWAKGLWMATLGVNLPRVVDADALYFLAQSAVYCEQWILTPHPQEAARLLETSVAQIEQDRFAAARAIQLRYGGVCVLKGAGSVIVGANNLTAVAKVGNPGMATAGMGDVLSGIIAAFIGQFQSQWSLFEIACRAVLMHGMAGDLAAAKGPRGMLASDLMPTIQEVVNK